MSNTIIDTLKQAIQSGKFDEAKAILSQKATRQDYPGYTFGSDKALEARSAKQVLYTILLEEGSTLELIDIATEKFVEIRPLLESGYNCSAHGVWVHDLSHLMGTMWERGLKSCVARLNIIAFKGAIEFADATCCDRLLNNFCSSASWNAVPAEYGFTEDNLRWVEKLSGSERKDVEEGLKFIRQFPFESEDKCPRKPFFP